MAGESSGSIRDQPKRFRVPFIAPVDLNFKSCECVSAVIYTEVIKIFPVRKDFGAGWRESPAQ